MLLSFSVFCIIYLSFHLFLFQFCFSHFIIQLILLVSFQSLSFHLMFIFHFISALVENALYSIIYSMYSYFELALN